MFKKFFSNWLYPLAFLAVMFVVFVACIALIENSDLKLFSLGLVGLGILSLLISAVIQFWKKKWLQAVVTSIIFCLFSAGFCIVLGIFFLL